MEQGSFNRFEEFTTDERACGVWIDGSKIYRKTITHSSTGSVSSLTIAHNISNLDTLIKAEGVRKTVNGSSIDYSSIPYTDTGATRSQIQLDIDKTNIYISVGVSWSADNIDDHITLYYTKSSS